MPQTDRFDLREWAAGRRSNLEGTPWAGLPTDPLSGEEVPLCGSRERWRPVESGRQATTQYSKGAGLPVQRNGDVTVGLFAFTLMTKAASDAKPREAKSSTVSMPFRKATSIPASRIEIVASGGSLTV